MLLELHKLGCALWLIGDPASQLLSIGNAFLGADLTGDISDTAMLRGAVDCRRCVFTEPKRCDERLFAWLGTIAAGGWRWQLPLADAKAQARSTFPKRGHPAQTMPVPSHAKAHHPPSAEGGPAQGAARALDSTRRRRTPGPAHAALARHAKT